MKKAILFFIFTAVLFGANDEKGRSYRNPVLDIYDNIKKSTNMTLLLSMTQGTTTFSEPSYLLDEKQIVAENERLLAISQNHWLMLKEAEANLIGNELKILQFAAQEDKRYEEE